MDDQEIRKILGLVAKWQAQFVREGNGTVTKSEANALAREMVMEELGITQDILSECYRYVGQMPKRKQIPPKPSGGNGHGAGITDPMRIWCEEGNDFIASNKELCFWTGYTDSGFGYARKILEGEGYEFERMKDARWKITKRPPEPEPEPQQELPIGTLPNLDILMALPDDKKQIFHTAMVALLKALE